MGPGRRHGDGSGAILEIVCGKELIMTVVGQKPTRSKKQSHEHSPKQHSS